MADRVVLNAKDGSHPWLWLVLGIPVICFGAYVVYYEIDKYGAEFLSHRWVDATIGFVLIGVGALITVWGLYRRKNPAFRVVIDRDARRVTYRARDHDPVTCSFDDLGELRVVPYEVSRGGIKRYKAWAVVADGTGKAFLFDSSFKSSCEPRREELDRLCQPRGPATEEG